jgi:hypothetical protein
MEATLGIPLYSYLLSVTSKNAMSFLLLPMFSLQQNQRRRRWNWGRGVGVTQTMHEHVSKFKNDKIKERKI